MQVKRILALRWLRLLSVLRGGSVVADLLFNVLPIVCGVLHLSLFCYTLLCVLSSIAIILKRKRELVTLLFLSYGCLVTVNVL